MKSKLIMLMMLVLLTSQVYAFTIDADLTADNHYSLYSGAADGSGLTYVGMNETTAVGNPGEFNWSLPESYTFTVNPRDYIYIAAWSDDDVAQGVLGQFGSILTNSTWEYWMTNTDIDDFEARPTDADVANEIGLANASGWTQVSNTMNNGDAPWGPVAGISASADWIWGSALIPGSDNGEYQIFRQGPIVPEPATMFLLSSLATGLFGFAGLRKRFTK